MLKYTAAQPPPPPPQMVCLEEALATEASGICSSLEKGEVSAKSVVGELQRIECAVCNVWMCGPIPMREHLKGAKHRKAVRQNEEGLYFGELKELEALVK